MLPQLLCRFHWVHFSPWLKTQHCFLSFQTITSTKLILKALKTDVNTVLLLSCFTLDMKLMEESFDLKSSASKKG